MHTTGHQWLHGTGGEPAKCLRLAATSGFWTLPTFCLDIQTVPPTRSARWINEQTAGVTDDWGLCCRPRDRTLGPDSLFHALPTKRRQFGYAGDDLTDKGCR